MAKSRRGGSLADLQKTTALLGGLLAQEARELSARRSAGEGAGDMKALREITAVLKDLAAVAKALNEQTAPDGAAECGVVLLPPVEEGKE